MWLLIPSALLGARLATSGADLIASGVGEESRDSSVIAQSWSDGALPFSRLPAAAMRSAKKDGTSSTPPYPPGVRKRLLAIPLSLRREGKGMRVEVPKGHLGQFTVGREGDGGGILFATGHKCRMLGSAETSRGGEVKERRAGRRM